MGHELMYISNFIVYNYWLKRLHNQLNKPTKSPKLLSKKLRKYYYKTFGTTVINNVKEGNTSPLPLENPCAHIRLI